MSRRSQEPSISHQHSTPNSKGSQVARVHPEEYLATLQTIDAHKPEFNISPLQSNNRIIHIRNIDSIRVALKQMKSKNYALERISVKRISQIRIGCTYKKMKDSSGRRYRRKH
jgi:hypothetical protein